MQLDAHYEQAGLVRGMTAAGDSCSPINEFARGGEAVERCDLFAHDFGYSGDFPKTGASP